MEKHWKIAIGMVIACVALVLYANFVRPPGPNWSNEACVLDPEHETVQYTYQTSTGIDYPLGTDTDVVRVGDRFANFERFDSLTRRGDGYWIAQFSNTVTGVSQDHVLGACPAGQP